MIFGEYDRDMDIKQRLYNLLEEADNDVEKGDFLTEEEMEKEIDLM